MLKVFVRWLLGVLYKVEVKGGEHLEQFGERTVVVANL